MKNSYPVILTPCEGGYVVYIPDFNINTEGKTVTDALEMAKDAIGIIGIELEDRNEVLPAPADIKSVTKENEDDIVSLVAVDFTEYRRKNDMRSVRRNVTLPSWLDFEAERSGINVSAVLQKALKQELHITDR
ncbi:MAG: HicB family protein [Clostridiales bacterium]|nr:MAG: HicB family protein [Clostridiales bacterium]